jgi:hypothetical protein
VWAKVYWAIGDELGILREDKAALLIGLAFALIFSLDRSALSLFDLFSPGHVP